MVDNYKWNPFRTHVYTGPDLWVLVSLSTYNTFLQTISDVTLADEDTNAIPNDYANRTISGNMAMQVMPWFNIYM